MTDKGRFFVVDGPDGCGKSTQVRKLQINLEKRGYEVKTVRDPGGTPVGEEIRQVLLNPKIDRMSVKSELFLYLASRTQLVQEEIIPALERGVHVISDRFFPSTFAYQGIAGNIGEEKTIALNEFATGDLVPDCTFLLDVSVEEGRSRLQSETDRMEEKTDQYHMKVRKGFQRLRERYPDRTISIDGSQSIQYIAEYIVEEACNRLESCNSSF